MNKINIKINIERDKTQRGIWQFTSFLSPVDSAFRMTLGEGGTEEIHFSGNIVLKREDKNPTGSLKDRGMVYLVSHAFSLGHRDFALPSSGNAAISAAEYCSLKSLNLTVFVSPDVEEGKFNELAKKRIKLVESRRPVSDSTKFAKENNFFDLRPSVNEFGPEGYQTIAFELLGSQGVIDNIFIPVSSGVALAGIAKGFQKMGFLPKIHLCQSSAVHPLASIFDNYFVSENESLAKSLVAKTTPLKKRIISLVKESKGTGWVIENDKIMEAQQELQKKGIETSNEGALALAAVYKARKNGWNLGKTACLLTGRKY